MAYWLPVVTGIATYQEVESMTRDQLEMAIMAANFKIKLLKQGGMADG
ncbi:hypothetical protein NCCP2716_27820 [Sporosarcina sp. NCCP-2716]|nr:hypothetical protein [Sporosarcina sp. NCCP-2716]GKV70284.1 hypothetical protein NCCP2716_27820 [Sporosarcina sp. NCCP-2716]